jgi:hypothetical protein
MGITAVDNYRNPPRRPDRSAGRRPDPGGAGAGRAAAGESTWGPDPWISSATLAGMLGALVWRLLDHDPENRVVATVLVVVCALVTLTLVRIRVRLRAGADGITVTGPLRSRRITWSRIHTISTPSRGRFGRRGVLLELEVRPPSSGTPDPDSPDDELLTFGRFDLGTDPTGVGRELLRRRAAAG